MKSILSTQRSIPKLFHLNELHFVYPHLTFRVKALSETQIFFPNTNFTGKQGKDRILVTGSSAKEILYCFAKTP